MDANTALLDHASTCSVNAVKNKTKALINWRNVQHFSYLNIITLGIHRSSHDMVFMYDFVRFSVFIFRYHKCKKQYTKCIGHNYKISIVHI